VDDLLLRARRFADPLADPSLRRMWYSRLASEVGDWAARIALSLMVYAETGRPIAATAVTAVALLPNLGIGQVLGTLADRYPHRTVMITTDLVRGVLYLFLAVVHLPVPWVLAVAFLAGMAEPPFSAAHSAAVPLLAGDRYLATLKLFTSTRVAMTLLGFALGGVLSAVAGPSVALGLNGVSFLVAVAFVAGIRPTRSSEDGPAERLIRTALRALTSDRLILVSVAVVTVGSLGGIAVESLMVAYAAHLGYGATGAGLLATVPPIAAFATTLVIPSEGEHARLVRVVCWTVAVLSAVACLTFLLDSPLPWVLVGFVATGVQDVLTVPAGAVIGERLPQASRGTAFSILEGELALAQAAGALAAGGLAAVMSVAHASALLILPACAVAVLGLRRVPAARGTDGLPAAEAAPAGRPDLEPA
jgi:MFS family permease